MSRKRKLIVLLSDDMLGEIWTYLSTWESDQLPLDLLHERADMQGAILAGNIAGEKARSLAYCLRNARECIRSAQSDFIPRVVARYYGCMWMVSAIMIADPTSEFTLDHIEARTKQGHGLGNIADDAGEFPQSEFIYLREQGLFQAYLRYRGLTKHDLKCIRPSVQRFDTVAALHEEDRAKLVSLTDILRRVPEINNYLTETIGALPLSFHVYHSSRNMAEKAERDAHNRTFLSPELRPPKEQQIPEPAFTWVGIEQSQGMDLDFIQHNGPPVTEWQKYESGSGSNNWIGKLGHPAGKIWWEVLPTHSSAMAPTHWIKPINGKIDDYMALHFMALYCLSILTRYRPSTWREVTEGRFNRYRVLISAYLQAFERVIPEICLTEITRRPVRVTQRGSWTAPI